MTTTSSVTCIMKLTLTTGRSGLILDLIIEDGNPADAERFIPVLDRHLELYKKPPRPLAADGAYASGDNLQYAKNIGVRDVAFHKKRGFTIKDMVKSNWVYRKLRNFGPIGRFVRRITLSRNVP